MGRRGRPGVSAPLFSCRSSVRLSTRPHPSFQNGLLGHRLKDFPMNDQSSGTALVIGVGDGLSASLARLLSREGYKVVLAARDTGKLADLAKETKADARRCD